MTFMNTARRIVPSEGPTDAKILMLGEAPGRKELEKLRPFVGPAGTSVLDPCLQAANIIRAEIRFVNTWDFGIKKVSTPYKTEIFTPEGNLLWSSRTGFTANSEESLQRVKEEIIAVNPVVVVPLGAPALEACCGKQGIMNWRGSIIPCTLAPGYQLKCVPTIHPSASLQSGDYLIRYIIVKDFVRAKEQSQIRGIHLTQRTSLFDLSHQEIMDRLDRIYWVGKRGSIVTVDAETLNNEISMLSFAVEPTVGFSIHFHNTRPIREEMEIWRSIAKILSDPTIIKGNQNLLFDMERLVMQNKIIVRGMYFEDPMVAFSICYPEFKKSLDFLVSLYTDQPYYSTEAKKFFKTGKGDIQKFKGYSCLDAMMPAEIIPKLHEELEMRGHTAFYRQTMKIYPILLAMMVRGIKVNTQRVVDELKRLNEQIAELEKRLNEKTKRTFKWTSSKECINYFYTELGIAPYLHRKTHRPTCDDKALSRLAKGTTSRDPIPEARLIQQLRTADKLRSTYFEVNLDKDGRLRCSWNPRGTKFGRLSSSKTLRQTGMNIQNQPMAFKRMCIADDGYMLTEVDKAQGEWVCVAYMSGDPNMIEVVEKRLDAHARTGNLITGIPMKLIFEENKLLGHETDPEILESRRREELPILIKLREEGHYLPRTMTIRQCGKKANHGLNYNMGYRRFAVENEVQEGEAKIIIAKYHAGYRNIRAYYYPSVERQLREDRHVANCFGTRCQFLDRWSPDLLNAAYDYGAQGTIAELVNRGLIRIYDSTADYMQPIEMLAQVHDSILLQYPIGDWLGYAKAMLDCAKYLDPVMRWEGREFRIRTDLKVGLNWADMEEIELGTDPERLAQRLSEVYGKLRA